MALRSVREIDILASEDVLAKKDFTPDILHRISIASLREATGVEEGTVVKVQDYAVEWYEHLRAKRAASELGGDE